MLDKINVCGVCYDVKWMENPILDEGKEHWAIITAEDRVIRIFKGLSEHDAKHVLMHEMAHEVCSALNMDMEESEIKLFIRMLFDSIDRNDLFTRNVK